MEIDYSEDVINLNSIPKAFNILIKELDQNPIFQFENLFENYSDSAFSYFTLIGEKEILEDYQKLSSIKKYKDFKKEVEKLSEKYKQYLK